MTHAFRAYRVPRADDVPGRADRRGDPVPERFAALDGPLRAVGPEAPAGRARRARAALAAAAGDRVRDVRVLLPRPDHARADPARRREPADPAHPAGRLRLRVRRRGAVPSRPYARARVGGGSGYAPACCWACPLPSGWSSASRASRSEPQPSSAGVPRNDPLQRRERQPADHGRQEVDQQDRRVRRMEAEEEQRPEQLPAALEPEDHRRAELADEPDPLHHVQHPRMVQQPLPDRVRPPDDRPGQDRAARPASASIPALRSLRHRGQEVRRDHR